MRRSVGLGALALSACGYPLTEAVIHRFGRRGLALSAAVCAALTARDASMMRAGAPGRLRRIPATLLAIELVAAGTATGMSLGLLAASSPGGRRAGPPAAVGKLRRAAVAALFTLHTVRFAIYLTPGQGRRRMPEARRPRSAALGALPE
ncbi:MAG TPA: hypothetical protein VEK76_03900 [Candidatus Binatia bacterium]|nr:hypothetical protein [Candidatus Binatia bacterium]